MKVTAIIPARLESARLKNKLLLDIGGMPMIMHVYNALKESAAIDNLYIATDSDIIESALNTFDVNLIKTPACKSGTERVIVASKQIEPFDILINVQGDEPLITHKHIESIVSVFKREPEAQIATLVERFDSESELRDPNNVKVVLSDQNKALYFSRSVIPYSNGLEDFHYKHIGVYAFRENILEDLLKVKVSNLRIQEQLEQLDWLVTELSIFAQETEGKLIGVDTKEDLEKVRKILSKPSNQD